MTPVQACISWVISKNDNIVPLIGCRTPFQLKEVSKTPRRLTISEINMLEDFIAQFQIKTSI